MKAWLIADRDSIRIKVLILNCNFLSSHPRLSRGVRDTRNHPATIGHLQQTPDVRSNMSGFPSNTDFVRCPSHCQVIVDPDFGFPPLILLPIIALFPGCYCDIFLDVLWQVEGNTIHDFGEREVEDLRCFSAGKRWTNECATAGRENARMHQDWVAVFDPGEEFATDGEDGFLLNSLLF